MSSAAMMYDVGVESQQVSQLTPKGHFMQRRYVSREASMTPDLPVADRSGGGAAISQMLKMCYSYVATELQLPPI